MKIEIDYYTDFDDKESLKKYKEFLKNYKKKVNKIVKVSLDKKNLSSGSYYIGIGIVSKESIKATNRESRNIDKVTDVLSFPMYDLKELMDIGTKEEHSNEQIALGDIVICIEKVEEQAIEYNTGFEREMLYMITHGMCHLMGFDHETIEEKTIMRETEEDILKKIEGEK